MNAPSSFAMHDQDILRIKLDVLLRQHRDLDTQIASLHGERMVDTFALQRLKREKLKLKDKITVLKDRLVPDIIA